MENLVDKGELETANCNTSDTEPSLRKKGRPQFSGTCGFLISLLGYSMGTSDFWRFPYLVFRNGGGAFLIPFALFMMICGLPMLFFEVTLSQFSGCGPLSMWNMAPFFKGIGFTLLVINLVNNTYYNVLRAWIIEYLKHTFQARLPWEHCSNDWNKPGCVEFGGGKLISAGNTTYNVTSGNQTETLTQMTAVEQFWQFRVLQLSSGLGHFDGVLWHFVFYVFIWRLMVTLCMIKSIKSIEKVMFVTVFIPIILMIVILIRALTLEGATNGMLYYITPTFDRITDIKVWLEAALMATYTLGPGWGTIPLIGSHNKFSGNTIRYSMLTTIFDFLSAVINGLICFAVLGVMAHDSGLPLERTVTSGLSLGFTVYPTAFTYFPLPQLWAAVFFINLMLVGLDSQILSTETVMNCLQDIFPQWFIGHRRLCMIIILNVAFFLLTMPFCTRGGIYVFQLLDWYAAAWTLLFVCFVECIVFSWIYGCDRINKDLAVMIGRPLPAFIRLSGAFVTPVIILILLILSFIRYVPPTYGSYSYPKVAEVIGWCLAIAIITPIFIVFLYQLIESSASCSQLMSKMRQSNDLWGPNNALHDTLYRAKCDIKSRDSVNQSAPSFLSTLKYNMTGRCHSNHGCDYTTSLQDEHLKTLINDTSAYDTKV